MLHGTCVNDQILLLGSFPRGQNLLPMLFPDLHVDQEEAQKYGIDSHSPSMSIDSVMDVVVKSTPGCDSEQVRFFTSVSHWIT